MFLNGPLEDSTDENQNEADPEQAVRKPRVSEKRIAAKGCPLRGSPGSNLAAGPLPSPASWLGSRGNTMEPSERVTWEDCPNCQRAAAVGWVNGRPVEFDCPRGCCLSAEQVQAFDVRRGRRPVDWLTRAS